jgi:predicted RecB family nuclease
MNKRKSGELKDELIYDFSLLDKLSQKKYKSDDKWISGTSVANYLNGEPLIDWLNLYYNRYGFNTTRITRSFTNNLKKSIANNTNNINNTHTTTLMSNGLKFESKVYEYLKQTYPDKFINVIPNDKINLERNFVKLNTITNDLIVKGVPLIAQAVLLHKQSRMRGVADLLVRSDFVNRLFKRPVLKSSEIKYKNKPYYVVIDIKWTSMTLCVDGETIRNDNRFKSYKGQLLIYNFLLGKIQNYTPPCAFIMAKNWKVDSKYDPQEGFSCFDLLGKINYKTRDNEYIKKTYDAINWVHNVRNNGLNYSPLNPSIKEMCVNMSNQNDTQWVSVKKELVKNTKDVTAIWNITHNHRDKTFDKNIKRWDQPDCNSESLGLSDGKRSHIINKILEINKQNQIKIYPNKLENIRDNRFNWQKKFKSDFYIDFETISTSFDENDDMDIFNSKNDLNQIIFMIGVGYQQDDEFKYEVFKMNELNSDEEKRILIDFKKFIDEKAVELDKKEKYNTRLFHWSHAEQTMLEKAFERHPSLLKMWENHIEWVDLCDIFTSEPIVVKGALCFKLKEIGNALYSSGLIDTYWDSSELSDGLSAMAYGIKYYKKENKNTQDEETFNQIIKYNKVDCKVLWDIVKMLRNLH